MRNRTAVCAALIALIMFSFQSLAVATIITDGLEDFSGGLSDWVVTDAIGSIVTESGGNDYALLEEDFFLIGSLSQDIMLDASHTNLEFDYALGLLDPSLDPGGFYDSFEVSLFTGTDYVSLFQDDFDFFDSTVLTDPSFIHQVVDLTAFDLSVFWGGPATLSFDIIDVDWWVNSGLALDNIHVASGGAAQPVPEPGTLLLLGMGCLALGVLRKKKSEHNNLF
ncbi:MAG: PEP-CTERM sorting domain-containing protein [Candidatus Margulisiibacteriota bacterium]